VKTMLQLRSSDDLLEAVRTARFAMVSAGYRIEDQSDTSFTADKGSKLGTRGETFLGLYRCAFARAAIWANTCPRGKRTSGPGVTTCRMIAEPGGPSMARPS